MHWLEKLYHCFIHFDDEDDFDANDDVDNDDDADDADDADDDEVSEDWRVQWKFLIVCNKTLFVFTRSPTQHNTWHATNCNDEDYDVDDHADDQNILSITIIGVF